jgi:Mrp family chromosome partitioning ATPase
VGKRALPVRPARDVIRRFGAAAVAAGLLAGGVGYGYAAFQPPVYQATAQMMLGDPDEASALLGRGMREDERVRFTRNQVELVTSTPVLERAAQGLNPTVRDQVRNRIRVSADPDLDILRVTASAPTARGAAGLADAVAEAYQQVVRERTLQSTAAALAELDRSRTALQERLAGETTRLDPATTVQKGVETSRARFGDGQASIAVIARNDNYVDGLAGTAAAANLGPVLFTSTAPPPDPTSQAELLRVLPRGRMVYVLGGSAALDPGIDAILRNLGYVTERLQGANRALTARQIENLAEDRADAAGDTRPNAGELPDDPIIEALVRRIRGEVAQLGVVNEQVQRITVNSALFDDGVEAYEPAGVPSAPVEPRPFKTGSTTGLAAFGGVLGFGLWHVLRHRRVEHRYDPRAVLDAPLLGVVPSFKSLKVRGNIPAALPSSPAAQAYDLLFTSLAHTLGEAGASAVVFTSPRPGDGKTVTAANLALAASHDGTQVMLVDADIRRRRLSQLCGVRDGEYGLVDVAELMLPVEDVVRTWQPTPTTIVPFVGAGSAASDPGGFFRTVGFRSAMRRLKASAPLMFVDSPPLLAVADPTAIAGHADGVILVISKGTPFSALVEARRRLVFSATPILGYVYTKGADTAGVTRYGYGYGDGQRTRGTRHEPRQVPAAG